MKKIISFILSVLFLLSFSSCQSDSEYGGDTTEDNTNKSVQITDFDNSSYTLTSPPERIYCASATATEIIYSLGASKYVKALNAECEKIDNAPMDAEIFEFDTNAVSKLTLADIDAVFYEDDTDSQLLESIKSSGIKTFRIRSSGGISVAQSNIRLISAIMFKQDNGEKLIDTMRSETEHVKSMAQSLLERKTVVIEGGTLENRIVYGGDTLIGELVSLAGGDNVYADVSGEISADDTDIISKNPDVFISLINDEKCTVTSIRQRNGYDLTNAYKLGQVYLFDTSLQIRPAPSLTTALYEFAYILETITENGK